MHVEHDSNSFIMLTYILAKVAHVEHDGKSFIMLIIGQKSCMLNMMVSVLLY